MDNRKRFKYRRWYPQRAVSPLFVTIKIDTAEFQRAMQNMAEYCNAVLTYVLTGAANGARVLNAAQQALSERSGSYRSSFGAYTYDYRGFRALPARHDNLGVDADFHAMTVTAAETHAKAEQEMAEWREILDRAKTRKG